MFVRFFGVFSSICSGTELVSCSLDHTLKLYDLAAGGRNTLNLTEHDAIVTSVIALGPSVCVSTSSDTSLRVWDVRANITNVLTLFDHDAAVYGVIALAQDSHTLVSASWDKTIKIWNVRMLSSSTSTKQTDASASGKCVRTLYGHTDAVRALVQLDDTHIASAGWDKTIRIWDLMGEDNNVDAPHRDSSVSVIKDGHTNWIYTLSYLPEQKLIVSGSGDKTIRLTASENGKCISVLSGHENTIWSTAALPPSVASSATAAKPSTALTSTGSFVSAGSDNQIRLWDIMEQNCMAIQGGHVGESSIYALDVYPNIRESYPTRKPLKIIPKKAFDATVTTNTSSSSSSNIVKPTLSAHEQAALLFEQSILVQEEQQQELQMQSDAALSAAIKASKEATRAASSSSSSSSSSAVAKPSKMDLVSDDEDDDDADDANDESSNQAVLGIYASDVIESHTHIEKEIHASASSNGCFDETFGTKKLQRGRECKFDRVRGGK